MAENKTKQNEASVDDFLNGIDGEQKLADAYALLEMMKEASGEEPKMWGASLIGFGYRMVKSPTSGREVEWFNIGFSPRKANFSIYLSGSVEAQHGEQLKRLGKHKTGKGCLYINKLSDVDVDVLKEMIDKSLRRTDYFEEQ